MGIPIGKMSSTIMGSTSLDSSWQVLTPITMSSMIKPPESSFMGIKNSLLLIPVSLQTLQIKSSCHEDTKGEPGGVIAMLLVLAKVGDMVGTRGSEPEALQSSPFVANLIK